MLNAYQGTDFGPGFADPVRQSQTTFRSVLNAMSRPGTVINCGNGLTPPEAVDPAAAAFLLTVADFETPVWFSPELADGTFATWLKFHSSCPTAKATNLATFAIIPGSNALPPLSHFAQGTEDYPDRSTTLVIQIESLKVGQELRLSGPGIDGTATLTVAGLSASFWQEWRTNNELFPCGVDLVLTAGTFMAALPRTSQVEF